MSLAGAIKLGLSFYMKNELWLEAGIFLAKIVKIWWVSFVSIAWMHFFIVFVPNDFGLLSLPQNPIFRLHHL